MSDEDPTYPTDPEECEACRIARTWHQARLCIFHRGERLRQIEAEFAKDASEPEKSEKGDGT